MTCVLTSKDIVARFRDRLAAQLGTAKFNLWFDESTRIRYASDDSTLRITVPSRFHADWIDRNFRTEIDASVRDVFESALQVAYDVDCNLTPDEPSRASSRDGENAGHRGSTRDESPVVTAAHGETTLRDRPGDPQCPDRQTRPSEAGASEKHWRGRNGSRRLQARPGQSRFDEHFDLDEFIAGPGNELALHAALRFVDGDRSFSPMCIHGGCGLGKTHLLQGICRRVEAVHPGASIRFVTGEAFTNEYIWAVRTNKLDEFRKKIRRLDLLAIDDVHFLSNKHATQNEFMCTFDAIGLSGARIVMASDNHPKHIAQLHQRLVSRLMSGMVVEVLMPSRETRLRILHHLAARRGMCINETAADAIVDRCIESVREIEGVLTRLQALQTVLRQHEGGRLDEPATPKSHHGREAIGMILVNQLFDQESLAPSRPVSAETIVSEIARRCHVTVEQIHGNARHKRIVLARSLSAYFLRELTTMSYPEVARALSKENHSTMLAAVRRIERLLADDTPVDLNPNESRVSARYAIDTLKSAIIANTRRKM